MWVDLIQNAALVLALGILYSILVRLPKIGKNWTRVLSGLLFGIIAIIGMMLPVQYAPGVIYDGRSIIMAMAGLFGGGVASAISVLLAGAFRIQIGGAGMWAGLATIFSSAMLGLGFRRAYKNRPETIGIFSLYALGIAVHAVMLACQLLIQPWPEGLTAIHRVWLPIMLVFPAATAIIGFLLGLEKKRVTMEQTLYASEGKYRKIMEDMQESYYEVDLTGNLTFFNTALCRLLGYSREELLGMNNREYTDPETAKKLYAFFNRVYRSGTPSTGVDWVITRKDGTRRTIEASVSLRRNVSGEPVGFHGVIRDVTDEKRTEQALRESEEKYRLIFNNVPLGIFHYDQAGVIVSCNTKFVDIIGSSREQLIGLNMLKLPDKRLVALIRDSLEGKSVLYEGDYHTVTSGRVIPIRVRFTPLTSEAGVIQGGIGIGEDITERRAAEVEQKKLQAQLIQSQKMESVGRLAGGVAHDFNNMLGVILGRAELLLAGMAPDDPHRGSVEAILRAGERSAALTRQLLAFARKQTIQPKVINLNDAIEEMLKMLRRLIGENIRLSWKPGASLWSVKMDPVQVDQILANLCVNAKDAIRDGGEISIETENHRLDEKYCELHAGFVPGDYVMLTVSDTGCGMDRETADRIFEPFFTTKGVGQGTGLGLSTVYGIVKQNGGFINVYSEPGQGTTFRLYFPKYGESVAGDKVAAQTEIPMASGEKVLLVEDEEVLLEMTKTMLEELGYRVEAKQSPHEALVFLRENPCDANLLLTDVVMPKMSGKELADEVIKQCEEMKILFMSGYTSNAIAHQGVLDKDVAFIQKPFSIRELAQKLREVLESA